MRKIGHNLASLLRYDPDNGVIFRFLADGKETPVGSPNKDGYLRFYVRGRQVYVHRVAWELVNGPIPAGMTIDHINRVKSDNRLINLRLATRAQNAVNIPVKNSTGFRGVFRNKEKFTAQIQYRGVVTYLGTFEAPELAARAYDAGARMMHGEFALLNFPEAAK